MPLQRQAWYVTDSQRIYGPFGPLEFHAFLVANRQKQEMSMSLAAESEQWLPLDEIESLVEALSVSIKARDALRLQSVVQIINCYAANKGALRLGKLRLAKYAVLSELPFSWFSFGGEWFREVEEELNEYLDGQRSWRIYSRLYKGARLPFYHVFQAAKLWDLLNVAEHEVMGKHSPKALGVLLAVIPGLFVYAFQNRLNNLWTHHLRRLTRRSERFFVDVSAQLFRYPSGGSRYTVLSEGKCSCLGFGGARLELNGPPQKVNVGDELFLALPSVASSPGKVPRRVAGDQASTFMISGRVAWTSPQGMGVRFAQLNQEQELYLANILQLNF